MIWWDGNGVDGCAVVVDDVLQVEIRERIRPDSPIYRAKTILPIVSVE